MAIKMTNNAASTLASNVSSGATSFTVVSGSSFPTFSSGDHSYVTIGTEVIKVTARNSAVFTCDQTTASHSAGDTVELRVTAELLNDFSTDAESLPKSGGAMTGAITTNSTFDGRDVRVDGLTADAALPKAGGTMTGNIAHAGAFTIDAGGDIHLDTGGQTKFDKNGTNYGIIFNSSNNLGIHVGAQDKDLVISGNDGGSSITALTLDMSSQGDAIFNRHIKLSDDANVVLGGADDLLIFHDHANQQNKMLSASLPVILAGTTVSLNNGANNQNMLVATQGGSVKLYNANAAKLETTSYGAYVTNELRTGSNIQAGAIGDAATNTITVMSSDKSYFQAKTQNDNENSALMFGNASNAYDGRVEYVERNMKFYTATAERMQITSAGNVGIGTTSAAHKLSIGTGDARIHLGYAGTSANIETGRISTNSYNVNNESYSLAEMSFITSSANGYTGGIQFRTNSVNSTNSRAAVRMTIDSVGKVGIGTTAPQGTTHIETASAGSISPNTAADDLVIENSTHGGLTVFTPNADNSRVSFGSPSDSIGADLIWNYDSGIFKMGADKTGGQTVITANNGHEGLRIDSSLNVGIGCVPTNRLTVQQNGITLLTKSNIGTAAHEAGSGFQNVGHATQGSRYATMWLDADGANFGGSDYYYIQKNGGGGVSHILQNAAEMTFATSGSNRMFINSRGNVKIGGGSPNVVSTSFDSLQVGAGGSISSFYNGVNGAGTDFGNNFYVNNGGTESYVFTEEAAKAKFEQGAIGLYVAASGSADAAITWNKGFEVLATARARAKNGLMFGTDTAAANALNDYEEGTWSSVLRLGGNGGTDNVNSTSYAKYTKVGNLVCISVSISMLNSTSGTGHLVITGLPFATASSAQLSVRFNDNMNSSDVVCQATGSAIHFYTQSTSTTGSLANFTNSGINSSAAGKHINVSGTYFTDA